MIKEYEQHGHVIAGRNIDAEYIFFKAYKGYTSILKLHKNYLMVRDSSGRTPVNLLATHLGKMENIDVEILKLPKEILLFKDGRGDTPISVLASHCGIWQSNKETRKTIKRLLKLPIELLFTKDEMGKTPKDFLLSVRLKNESILHKLFQIFSKGKLSWT